MAVMRPTNGKQEQLHSTSSNIVEAQKESYIDVKGVNVFECGIETESKLI